MVFEHLFPDEWLQHKRWTAFLLAFIYATISIVLARLVFPANSGLVAVVFVSIFLIPYFQNILKREVNQELSESKFNFINLLKNNMDAIQIYFALFFGIYIAFMLYSFLMPMFGQDIGVIFREQLSLESLRGGASFNLGTFASIALNNWWVLLACFMIALLAGDGAIFFIAWNASAWGTIFGYRALAASQFDGSFALFNLLLIFTITLPHLILEGGAYILAAIAGGVISDEIDQREEIMRFVMFFIFATTLYLIAFWFSKAIIHTPIIRGFVGIGILMSILWVMHNVFTNERDNKVFRYNYWLFAMAITIFMIGAMVETLILTNSETLSGIYIAALMFGM